MLGMEQISVQVESHMHCNSLHVWHVAELHAREARGDNR